MREVRVIPKEGFDDPRGDHVTRQARQLDIGAEVESSASVYHIEGISEEQAKKLAEVLADSVTQDVSHELRKDWEEKNRVEIAPLPGVMNPDITPIMEAARLTGVDPKAVQTGIEYYFQSGISKQSLQEVVDLLVNSTVEQVRDTRPQTLEISGTPEESQVVEVRDLSDSELIALSKERKLALSLPEMQAIREKARSMERDLTDVELEYLAAAWSEHCCHKTFNAEIRNEQGEIETPLFTRIKEGSTPYFEERGVLSAFHDNSGVWYFHEGKALCIKLETHNSPMNLEPHGGSATGTGGVLRDIVATGKGAKPINSQHMQFLAPLNYQKRDVPEGCHTPRYLIERSVAGVRDYGNRMGVPTNDVSFHTHPDYRGKGSILVGALGIMPEANAQKGEPQHGDLVIAAGGKTGRDGLHGATFSSESADSNTSSLHSGAVQIGNPIEEKKVFDAILEASDKGLIKAMTDCGAAGFASAVGEMGEDIGVTIDLANAPLKYEGLSPWEIFLSESQERMVMAVDPVHQKELQAIFDKHNSEVAVLGTFGSPEDEEPSLHVKYSDETVAFLDYDFIKNGFPDQVLDAAWVAPRIYEREPEDMTLQEAIQKVLANGNVCSTEPILRQYDHEVQGTNALKPYGGVNGDGRNEAVVMTPLLDKPYGVIEAHGCNPALTELDPRNGSIWAYVEAMSNYVAVGGNPDDAIIVNNYISATPTPRVLGGISQSVDALMGCVEEFRSPIISGKDSLSSTFKFPDGKILESPYNLIITVAGKIPDVEKTVSNDIKKPGSVLVLIGKQDLEAMGGSVYYEEAGGKSASIPQIDLPGFHKTAQTLHQAINDGKILSAQDISEGGLAATVTQMAIGGNCGAILGIENEDIEKRLFNETAGCFVVEVETPDIAEELFAEIDYTIIGRTQKTRGKAIIDICRLEDGIVTSNETDDFISIKDAKEAWEVPFKEILE